MSQAHLETRLSELNARIDKAKAHLSLKGLLSGDHQATAEELRARYAALTAKLREETADAEAHGHHVSDLEASVRQWLDSLEIEMD